MITSGEEWHYLTVKKLSALLRRATSKHNGEFHCLNYFHLFSKKENPNHIKQYVKIKIFAVL